MAWPKIALWYSQLGGYNAQPIETIRQDEKLLEFSQAQNVIAAEDGKLITAPGFSAVRASAPTGVTAYTGMSHMGGLVDSFILTTEDGTVYQDSANPPAEITGGTVLTTGITNLTRFDVFNALLIIVSQSRDLPQTLNASLTRADLGGTPARGLDVKAFGRRLFMFSPIYSGTTYRHLVSFSSTNDSQSAWVTPVTTNALSFGRYESRVNVLGGERFRDHLIAFTQNEVYPIYVTPNADLPFATQDALMNEEGGGPPVIHSVVAANDRLYWLSLNYDVKMMTPDLRVHSIGYAIQPFLRQLADAYRIYTVGGWEPRYRMVVWSVTDAGATTPNRLICLKVDTGQYYIITRSRASFANRTVSGQLRLIGGGVTNGLFFNEFTSATTGDIETAASAIDADVMSGRIHLGMPHTVKKVPFCVVEVDPIGTEAITFQHQLDDAQTWTSFPTSPVTVSSTDRYYVRLDIPSPFVDIRLRFRDANSGERYRILRVGFPKPTSTWAAPS